MNMIGIKLSFKLNEISLFFEFKMQQIILRDLCRHEKKNIYYANKIIYTGHFTNIICSNTYIYIYNGRLLYCDIYAFKFCEIPLPERGVKHLSCGTYSWLTVYFESRNLYFYDTNFKYIKVASGYDISRITPVKNKHFYFLSENTVYMCDPRIIRVFKPEFTICNLFVQYYGVILISHDAVYTRNTHFARGLCENDLQIYKNGNLKYCDEYDLLHLPKNIREIVSRYTVMLLPTNCITPQCAWTNYSSKFIMVMLCVKKICRVPKCLWKYLWQYI